MKKELKSKIEELVKLGQQGYEIRQDIYKMAENSDLDFCALLEEITMGVYEGYKIGAIEAVEDYLAEKENEKEMQWGE